MGKRAGGGGGGCSACHLLSDHGAQLRWKEKLRDNPSDELILVRDKSEPALSTFCGRKPEYQKRRKPTSFGRTLNDSFH